MSHQSTLCAPPASQESTSPAANKAPAGVHVVMVSLYETPASPRMNEAVGSYLASSFLICQVSDGTWNSDRRTCWSVGLDPPVPPEKPNGYQCASTKLTYFPSALSTVLFHSLPPAAGDGDPSLPNTHGTPITALGSPAFIAARNRFAFTA